MASPRDANNKRHVFWDTEDTGGTNTDFKRICLEPSRNPIALDSPSNFKNIWKVEPCNVFPDLRLIETASEPLNNLIALPSAQFTTDQYIHDAFSSLPNHAQIPEANYAVAGCAPPSQACRSCFQAAMRTFILNANLSYRYFNTVLRAQTPPPEFYTTAVTNTSQHNEDFLSTGFTAHVSPPQQLNDLEYGWANDEIGLSINQWTNPATPLSHHHELSPHECQQHSTFAEIQSVELDFLPGNFENSVVETGDKAGFSTEWTYMEDQVHPVVSETTAKLKVEIGDQSLSISEHSKTALDSSDSQEPSSLHGVSYPSSSGSMLLNACDKVHDLKSITGLPPLFQYDGCFGVVSHWCSVSRLKGFQ